jgi:hypothetical protein
MRHTAEIITPHPVYPTLLIQNAETDRVETVSTLEQVGFVEQFGTKYRLEDFRLFEYQKTLYASHVVIFEKAPGYNRTVQVISHVDPLRSRLTFVCAPNLPIHQTQVEKNWVFFVHLGSLICLRDLSFPSLFALTGSLGENKWIEVAVPPQPILPQGGSIPSISAHPVSINGDLMLFYHYKTPDYQYLNHAAVFSGIAPYAPLGNDRTTATSMPIISSKNAKGVNSGVVYVMSAVYLRNRGVLRIYFGEGDAHSSYLDFDAKAFYKNIMGQLLKPNLEKEFFRNAVKN